MKTIKKFDDFINENYLNETTTGWGGDSPKDEVEITTEEESDVEEVSERLSDVKIKKGKMHKILGIPEDKEIEDVYTSGSKLAKDLVAKVGKKKASSMINFAANINSANNIFDKAQKSLENIE